MQLTRALEQATSPRSRARGAEYFRAGSVVHFDPQSSFVYAVVHGGEDYVVRLELAGRTIRGTCTCPFFNDRLEPCKHLWAVALMCDAERALQPPVQKPVRSEPLQRHQDLRERRHAVAGAGPPRLDRPHDDPGDELRAALAALEVLLAGALGVRVEGRVRPGRPEDPRRGLPGGRPR